MLGGLCILTELYIQISGVSNPQANCTHRFLQKHRQGGGASPESGREAVLYHPNVAMK